MPARIHVDRSTLIRKDKKDQLEAFLGQVKEHELGKFVEAVERDRIGGGEELPHETLLDIMRPALREKTYDSRVPSPERLFAVAFEDLLNALPGRRKQFGRISRSSIRPMWNWLKRDLLPGEFEEIEARIKSLVVEEKMDEANALVHDLQIVAGNHMHEELDRVVRDNEEYEDLSEHVGGPGVVADLRDMAMCLEVNSRISEIQSTFPRPYLGFDEDGLSELKRIYEAFRAHNPEHSAYCLLVIVGRMARPWEILSAIETLTENDGLEVTPEDMEVIAELLLDDVDIIGLNFVGVSPEESDHEALLNDLNIFVQITGGVLRGIGLQKDEARRQRFKTTKNAVSQQMTIFVEAMPNLILKAVPTKQTGDHGVRMPRIPDTQAKPDADYVNTALDYTKLFIELRFYADQTGFGAAYSRSVKEFDHRYERFKNDILDLIRNTEGSERQNAESFAEVLAQIGEVYKGDVEADMIRRRAVSAAEEGPSPIELVSSSGQ